MTIAVLTEKPSVARDIARVLGANESREGVLRGGGYAVTWALGHLVGLAEPHQMRPQWKRWQMRELPMIPETWPLEVSKGTSDRFDIVAKLLRDPQVEEVVCATDAGREGELIFRYIFEAAGATKPVKRLWVSSLTAEAIREGLANLRDGSAYDGLADAARGRSRADWLVGMNLSRAYTLIADDTLSVGRVQTPTLAMIVERELEIRNFVSEDYREVVATFAPDPKTNPETYAGTWFREPTQPPAPAPAPAERKDAATLTTTPTTTPTAPAAEAPSAAEAAALARRLPADDVEAQQIIARALAGRAEVESAESRQRKLPPPLLYDLTELQRHANRLFGFSAKRTLDIAQSLYETKKLLSYPRTGSRHLSKAIARGLGRIVLAIREPYVEHLAPDTGERALGTRYVDDARVTDHHAIIPTTTPAARVTLSRDEARLYDLVCRRLLSAWHEDHLYSTTTVITRVHTAADAATGADAILDRYKSTGTTIDREGWKALDLKTGPPKAERRAKASAAVAAEPELPSGLAAGRTVSARDAKSVARKTRPPNHLTDSTLLTAMETAGRTLEDKELSDAMRGSGLGTPATRAAIIETLLGRGFIERKQKSLIATEKGISLVELVHEDVRSPRMTGEWEARLAAIERGQGSLEAFMKDIERYVRGVVQRIANKEEIPGSRAPTAARSAPPPSASPPSLPSASPSPRPSPAGDVPSWLEEADVALRAEAPEQLSLGPSFPQSRTGSAGKTRQSPAPVVARARIETPPAELAQLLHAEFGFEEFRPHQEEVCRAVVLGRDALLVMPTGAGKSLCYQLPGIARAGTTLVVSPLIALMEDQVAKLAAQGFAAERIHSGRKRAESQQVVRAYLAGALDFLFIAPERLGVPGFPEVLARRKPSLIAIDEAHCISQWGHDFRPDYRMLGERLPQLRPAPIIALTATATPLVQRDITVELGMQEAEHHIHGFRRDNIFIEHVEMRPGARDDAAVELLSAPERCPAIVYAPTRKKAEDLATALAKTMRAAAYHAGIATAKRDRVQTRFLSGELDVIVATIAFGMGIDKADVRTVVHTALPGSVEGYYQEIGRAGRDGKPSRAVLYHSYADRRTHAWFLDRDYPEPALLERLAAALTDTPTPRHVLNDKLRMDDETLEKALEKLWIHRGAIVDHEDRVRRGPAPAAVWQKAYRAQRKHREAQLEQVARMAEDRACHMLNLVRHFGDQADSGAPCGGCASCAPEESVAAKSRTATELEQAAMAQVIDALRERDGQSKGRVHRSLFGEALERRAFEHLVGGMLGAKLLTEENDSFESEGEVIHFARLFLTDDGRRCRKADLAALQLVEQPAVSSGSGKRGAGGTRRKTGKRAPRKRAEHALARAAESTAAPPEKLVKALRAWRAGEAKRRRCPAFRVLSDRALLGIASEIPRDEDALLGIRGMGPTLVAKHGAAILEITSHA